KSSPGTTSNHPATTTPGRLRRPGGSTLPLTRTRETTFSGGDDGGPRVRWPTLAAAPGPARAGLPRAGPDRGQAVRPRGATAPRPRRDLRPVPARPRRAPVPPP